MLEKALQGARLLYAYTLHIDAPLDVVFNFTGNPDFWTRDFDGAALPRLSLTWEGRRLQPGSIMTLSATRADGTVSPVGAVPMELIYYAKNEEITYRYLVGNYLIYRFVYEAMSPTRTEFTVNVLVSADSPPLNTIRQRLYAKRRRKASIDDHLRVKGALESRARHR